MCSHVYGQLNDRLASATLVFVHFRLGTGGRDTARVPPAPNPHPLTSPPAFLCREGKAKLSDGMFVCL